MTRRAKGSVKPLIGLGANAKQGVLLTLRSGVYIVPTDRWYVERTVWLIAGVALLASTAMALLG